MTCTPQLTAIVYDDLYPDTRATGNLTVEVQRNVQPPRFTQQDYSVNVLEIAAVGSRVAQVQATDQDGVSVTA